MCYSCALAGTSVLRSKKKDPHADPEGPDIEQEDNLLGVFSDADWAGDKGNRRSVSGSVIFLNGQFVYPYSRNQKTVALSSGESEYYALAGAVSEAIGIREAVSFAAAKPTKLKAYTDSSAARGIVNRCGVFGRVKHMATRLLWLQEVNASGICTVHPVSTLLNPTDLGTKSLSTSRIKLLLNLLSFRDNQQEACAAERQEAEQTLSIRRMSRAARSRFNWLAAFAVTKVAEGYPQQEEGSSRKFESEEPPFLTMFETVAGTVVSMTLLFAVCAVVMCLYLKLQHALELAEVAKKEKKEEKEDEKEEEEKEEDEEK